MTVIADASRSIDFARLAFYKVYYLEHRASIPSPILSLGILVSHDTGQSQSLQPTL